MVKYKKEKLTDCKTKHYKSKIIGEEELVNHVEEGWEIVRENFKFCSSLHVRMV